MVKWTPLPMLAHGRIVKSFLPNDKHPDLKQPYFKNLYPGDEVYIFETYNNWARGYILSHPFPTDFSITSIDLDNLPSQRISVVLFPLNHSRIIERVQIPSNLSNSNNSSNSTSNTSNLSSHISYSENPNSSSASIPTLLDTELVTDAAINGEDSIIQANKSKPSLPVLRLDSGNLLDEITPAIYLLNSHMYALYSIGEFNLFNKLSELYYELDDTRLRLTYKLCTKAETKIARKTAASYLGKIAKLLASRGLNKYSDVYSKSNDTSGYEAIMARSAETGELFDFKNNDIKHQPNPASLALNQLLFALAPNYPVSNSQVSLEPAPNSKLMKVPPSHILVDFKAVSGSASLNPKGFAGMIAYLYLRSTRKRLTEAFAVHINSAQDLLLENLSAALFKNIPATEIDNGRIYLVANLIEEIDIDIMKPNSIKRIKKGIAAGVTDISRVFSRHKGALTSGEAHQFVIKLYGSYINHNDSNNSPVNMNNGWGELIDRIISGSNKGVAVNPRAEKLVISVKEFKNELLNNDFEFTGSSNPIAPIRTIFFDPLGKTYERIYLRMGKVSLINSINKDAFITIQISSPNNENITFAKATNQKNARNWQFVSVFPNEAVGEIIKINGISKNANMRGDEYVTLTAFVNGEYIGEGKLQYRSKDHLTDYKRSHNIELISNHNLPVANVEITSEYIGKFFNMDPAINNILNWKTYFKSLSTTENNLITTLIKFNKVDLNTLIKYFPELLINLLEILEKSYNEKLINLSTHAFSSIVYILDLVIARQDQYIYLFDTFMTNYPSLPQVGPVLISMMDRIFTNADKEWNATGRALCRVSSLVVNISTSATSPELGPLYINSSSNFIQSVCKFLNLKSDSLISDQVLILEVVDHWSNSFRGFFDDQSILQFITKIINSIGTRGLGTKDESVTTSVNSKKRAKEHKVIISKLLLIRRSLSSFLVSTSKCRDLLIGYSIDWSMEILLGTMDIDASRLASGILISICSIVWEDVVKVGNAADFYLCRGVSRLLPVISKILIRFNKFSRNNGFFKPKRTFTQLFPCEYPFNEITMDSVVNDEIFVEVLIELSTVFTFITRIAKLISGNQGFDFILASSNNDALFSKSEYFVKSFANDDLLSIIQAAKLLTQSKFYPNLKWLSLHSMFIESALTSLELLKFILIKDHIPPVTESESFDRLLWGNYLKACLKFGTAMPISIEHLSEIPRKACWKITGDIRNRISSLVHQTWECLAWDALEEDVARFQIKKFGGYQVEFINYDYGVLQDLMLFCLQRHTNCQAVGVKMLWSIIVSEWILSENLMDIEKECIVGLYEIFNQESYKPNIYEQKNFIKRLKMTIRVDQEDEAFQPIYNFIEILGEFLEVLNDLNNVPLGEEFDDDRTFHKLNIKGYLKNVNKPELLHSFINEMYENNLGKTNYVQAALSLELLASTYDWTNEVVCPASIKPKFPEQTSFERKETLYKLIATNYIKGNSFEKAVDIYKDLCEAYNKYTYDLKGLSYVHNKLSKLYLELESLDRLTPSYFRIAFIGSGFPKATRGRQYIYEGLPFEHITSIHDRLLRLHPGARIISNDDEAKKLLTNIPSGRYLHVSVVEPSRDFSTSLINSSIGVKRYAEHKDLRYFTTKRRLPGATSVTDLWTEETTYETFLSFPTLMNRSEIKVASTIKLSPLENAIRQITDKNSELINNETMINIAFKEKSDTTSLFNDLSRQVSGTVDSPVNGGVGQYRVFFNDDVYSDPDPNQLEILRSAFNDLAIILNRCLILHSKLVPSQLKASHDSLVDLYKKNFREEISSLNILSHEIDRNSMMPSASVLVSPSNNTYSYNGSVNGSTGGSSGHISNGSVMNISMTGGNSANGSSNGNTNMGTGGSYANINGNGHASSILTRSNTSNSANSNSDDSTVTNANGRNSVSTQSKRTALNWRQSRSIGE